MKTELLPPEGYRRAAELLARGELVVIPTETVYGLGASAVDRDAVRAVFEAKGRPPDNPLIVHLGDADKARDIVPRDLGLTREILNVFSPGPVTVIIPAPAWAIPEVRGGLPTVAIRVPDVEIARRIITASGVPVAAPSANRSGRPSPTTVIMALEEMHHRVSAVLDGGDCPVGIESTIIDATNDREAIILRPGRITARQIKHELGCPVRHREHGDSPSPGSRYRHYTPRVPVVLVQPEEIGIAREEAAGLFPDSHGGSVTVLSLEQFGDFDAYAEKLYRAFWDAERGGSVLILAEVPPVSRAEGLVDRLQRASIGDYRRGTLAHVLSADDRSTTPR